MLTILSLCIGSAALVLLADWHDRRVRFHHPHTPQSESPIARTDEDEKRWIELGYSYAVADGAQRDKELALAILNIRKSIQAQTIAQCAEWLEMRAIALGQPELQIAAEVLQTNGLSEETP